MATRKRQGGDSAEEERRTRRRGQVEEVTDDEVEEFFAILQRMREASRFFAARGCGGGDDAGGRGGVGSQAKREVQRQGTWRWRPAFEWEDFEMDQVTQRRSNSVDEAPDTSGGRGRPREAIAEETVEEEEEEAGAENRIPGRLLDLNLEPANESESTGAP